MAARRLAWVLNLDADLELAAGRGYTPKRSVREAMQAFVPLLARSLLGPDDMLVDESTEPLSARGFSGRAFCPTPRALEVLRRAGAEPEPHPSADALRRVNSRAFVAALGPMLPGAAFVSDLEAVRAKLDEAPPAIAIGGAWRVKRAFGMTGRGQRVVVARTATEADLAFARAGLAEGGVQIEPNVAVEKEYAMHGMLGADAALRLGKLVEQRCDPRGAWLSTETIASPTAFDVEVEARLAEQGARVARALSEAGYFGPFGMDAFAYRELDGAVRLQPLSEVNARYSMGYAIGFAGVAR